MRYWLVALALLGCDGGGGDDGADGARPEAAVEDGGPGDAAGADLGSPADAGADAQGADAAARDLGLLDAAPPADQGAPPPGCAAYAPPVTTGHLAEPGLGEVSGIAASRQSPGVLWLHNDSGDDPVLYATGEDGAALGRLTIPDAGVLDLEDIAVAACPGGEGWCLWAADVGDNSLNRPAVAIYAVREPTVAGPFAPRDAEVVQRYIVRYPDGAPHDAEALAVAPGGDRFWLFSKLEGGDPHVYEWRTSTPGPGALTDLGAFRAPGVPVPMGKLVTGADLDPSGRRLALRVYTGSYEYTLPAAGDLSNLAGLTPRTIAVGPLSEPQGEAIAYAADGLAVWTISEDQAGGQPLHRYGCRE